MEETKDERVAWTSELIDAVLSLRFRDKALATEIDGARGNEAKRKAWAALAARFQQERGVCIAENKIRRVVSKWQSQYRSWALASKNGATSERPPTYIPVLQRYFEGEAGDVLKTPKAPPVAVHDARLAQLMLPEAAVDPRSLFVGVESFALPNAANPSKKRKTNASEKDTTSNCITPVETAPITKQPLSSPHKKSVQDDPERTEPERGSKPHTITSRQVQSSLSPPSPILIRITPSPLSFTTRDATRTTIPGLGVEVHSAEPTEHILGSAPAVVSQDEESPATSQDISQNYEVSKFTAPPAPDTPYKHQEFVQQRGIPERPKRICPPTSNPAAPGLGSPRIATSQFRKLAADIIQQVSKTHQDQLLLQKKQFEQLLELQKSQYNEQFALQRKQVEVVQVVLEALGVSVTL